MKVRSPTSSRSVTCSRNQDWRWTPSAALGVRLAESLQPGCPLIVYGNMSGRAATFPWSAWTQSALIVRGFSLRQWMIDNKKKVPKMMETLGKLAATIKSSSSTPTTNSRVNSKRRSNTRARTTGARKYYCASTISARRTIPRTRAAQQGGRRPRSRRDSNAHADATTRTRRVDTTIHFKYECLNFDNISKFLFRGILTHPSGI